MLKMKVTFLFSGGLELVTETTEAVVDIDATEMKMSDVIAYVQKNLVKSSSQPFINGNNVFVSSLLLSPCVRTHSLYRPV